MGRKVISMFIVGILLISTQVDMVMGVNLEKILTLKPGDGDTDLNITRPISDRFVLFPIFDITISKITESELKSIDGKFPTWNFNAFLGGSV